MGERRLDLVDRISTGSLLPLALIFLFWATPAAGAGVAVASPSTPNSGAVADGFLGNTPYHMVQAHETLFSLAKRFGTTLAELVTLNGIGSDFKIRVGQRLLLPASIRQVGVPAHPAAVPAALVRQTVAPVAAPRTASAALGFPSGNGLSTSAQVVGLPPGGGMETEPAVRAASVVNDFTPTNAPIKLSDEERLLLARLVTAEAGNEPATGQLAVAAVVLNRLRHPSFPKTLTEVIEEPGQFKSVELGRVDDMQPTRAALAAVDQALAGDDPSRGALFFYNPVKSVALDFWKTRPVTVTIGGHNFAK